MKKVYAVNLCVLMFMLFTTGMTAGAADDDELVKDMLSRRTEILEQYFHGGADADECRAELERIESGSLLRQDVENMKAFAATDIESILDFRIRILSCRRSSYGIVKGRVEILYVMAGCGTKRTETCQYFFTAEERSEALKLTQLKVH